LRIAVRVLDPGLPLPRYARPGDAGLDLVSAQDLRLEPGRRAAVATGIAVELPEGYAGFVHARSGRALHEGLALVNAPGVVDAGYRGELKVIVVNLDPRCAIDIRRGEKIAQLIVQRVEEAVVEAVELLGVSERGDGGFGSTGR
jgi:dUTP pyrophosphatase